MKRTIQIDLETARQWFKGSNATLKELALKAYSEDELKFSYEAIFYPEIVEDISVSSALAPKMRALHKWAFLAKHFNSKRVEFKSVYFLAGMENGDYKISSHESVRYPGIVYFKLKSDLIRALQELTKDELYHLTH